ncbi:unnamed protein product [Adineta ricciae]|uniref:Uncharacterized protein n=1 Tax=Adineta ricciae TaxID=249248 RepID=A0A813X701_ADIRI|nr:unnamed protein product [Adineta ricciae]CAF1430851.1 unnamed protein product [Adineta ricciae]
MTGVPRTLYKEEVYVSYRRQALNILPGDLFLILQRMKTTEVSHGVTINAYADDQYQTAINYLSPKKLEWISINDTLGAVNDAFGYAKWKRCLDYIETVEKANRFRYDFIVRTRPDLIIPKDLPTVNLLPHDRILINPYYECSEDIPSGYTQTWSDHQAPCDNKNYGLSDMFAIIPRSLADPYMNVAYTQNLPRHICGSRASHSECAIRAVLVKANITFELWPFIVKISRSAQFCKVQEWNRFNSWC